MKVILFIACAIVAVYGDSEQQEGDLNSTVDAILESIDSLQKNIESILEEANKVEKKIEGASEQVASIVANHEQINNIQTALEVTASKGKNVEECQTIFNNGVHNLTDDLKTYVQEILEGNLQIARLSVDLVNEELDKIKDTLTNDLDAQLELCKKDSEQCKITNDFIKATQDHFDYIDTLKPRISSMVESLLSRVQNKIIFDRSQNEILEPINDCLKNSN